MANKWKDMSGLKHAIALSGLNEGLRSLIKAIFEDTKTVGIKGANKKVSDYFNHGYDKDPATNGGGLAPNITVLIYYQPASQKEYDNYEVIDKQTGLLSGRRRLVVRIEPEGHPSTDCILSVYTTNHPEAKNGIKNNNYGTFVPVDPKR